MSSLKRVVLDVLKPHEPSGLDFTRTLADLASGLRVIYENDEMDEKTESVVITIEGENIDMELVKRAIEDMGASLHSVDEIEFTNQ